VKGRLTILVADLSDEPLDVLALWYVDLLLKAIVEAEEESELVLLFREVLKLGI